MKPSLYFLPYDVLNNFFNLLKESYKIIGPTLENDHITYTQIACAEDLPWGYVAEQGLGHYALKKTQNKTLFAWVNSMSAVKPTLFKPKELLWTVERDAKGKLVFQPCKPKSEKLALYGIRPCDLKAILIQDEVMLNSAYEDESYKAQRENNFIIAANCSVSSNNCFCVAMGDWPQAKKQFDVALTEINNGFLFETGSAQAQSYALKLKLAPASKRIKEEAEKNITHAANMQSKTLKSKNLPKDLFKNLDHPYYETVAKKCLSCGNCTQVCPTCFCHNEIEEPALGGESSEHYREWGSCFTQEHSYIHGKTIRADTKNRYRQWLTHKFGSWQQQFGTNGCVGCGRCISWCPTGIDVTEVLNHICEDDSDAD